MKNIWIINGYAHIKRSVKSTKIMLSIKEIYILGIRKKPQNNKKRNV